MKLPITASRWSRLTLPRWSGARHCSTAPAFASAPRSVFRWGRIPRRAKSFETADAIGKGATEIDTVINVRALKAGNRDLVYREIASMVEICKPRGVISKVILETCYLTEEEKVTVCEMAVKAGADFVKTSTGFGTAGATVGDVKLMRGVCGPRMGVKAAVRHPRAGNRIGNDRSWSHADRHLLRRAIDGEPGRSRWTMTMAVRGCPDCPPPSQTGSLAARGMKTRFLWMRRKEC